MFSLKFNCKIEGSPTLGRGDLQLCYGDNVVGSWASVSGNWGKGALPEGEYIVNSPFNADASPKAKSFKKQGFAWLCGITPMFKTERDNLAIHPDGGIFGTLGCIGIEDKDIQLYHVLTMVLSKQKALNLKVTYA